MRLVYLPQKAPAIEPVDHGQALGMLGDPEVFETLLLRSLGHLLQRAVTIGGDRVVVQIAAQVRALDQGWQQAVTCGLDLAAVLAQLRGDVGQIDGGEDTLFRLAGQALVILEDAVFVDLESAGPGQSANRNIVGFVSGEVVQGRAEASPLHHPKVHLQPAAQE